MSKVSVHDLPEDVRKYLQLQETMKKLRLQIKQLSEKVEPLLSRTNEKQYNFNVEGDYCDVYGHCCCIRVEPNKQQAYLSRKVLKELLHKLYTIKFGQTHSADNILNFAEESTAFIMKNRQTTIKGNKVRIVNVKKKVRGDDEDGNVNDAQYDDDVDDDDD